MKRTGIVWSVLFAAVMFMSSCSNDPAADPTGPTADYMSITINGVESTFTAGPSGDWAVGYPAGLDGLPVGWIEYGMTTTMRMMAMKNPVLMNAWDSYNDGIEIDISQSALLGDLSAPITGENIINHRFLVDGIEYMNDADDLAVKVDKAGKNGEQVSGSFTVTLMDPESKEHAATGKFSIKAYDPSVDSGCYISITVAGVETTFTEGPVGSSAHFWGENIPSAWWDGSGSETFLIVAMESAEPFSTFSEMSNTDPGVAIGIMMTSEPEPMTVPVVVTAPCQIFHVVVGGTSYTSTALSVTITSIDESGGLVTGTFTDVLVDEDDGEHSASGSFSVKRYTQNPCIPDGC